MNLLPDLIINAIVDGYANDDFSFALYLINCYDSPSFEEELNYTLAHFAAKKVETWNSLKWTDVGNPEDSSYDAFLYNRHYLQALRQFKQETQTP